MKFPLSQISAAVKRTISGVFERNPRELKPWPNNPRVHSQKQLAKLKASIRKFGFTTVVVVDENGTILCGHGRVQATIEMGLDIVPVRIVEGLTEKEKLSYVPSGNPDPTVIALINKGYDWFERLTSGRYDSLNAIAKEEKVDSSYVSRLIYLAFLDPAIVQRILKGDHPEELTAKRLMQIVPLPVAWSEQRAVLGMSS